MLPAIFTVFLWSYCLIPARRSVRQLGENQANVSRLWVALGALALISSLGWTPVGGSVFFFFLLSGIVGFGLGDLGLFYALPRLGSRMTIIMAQCLAAPLAGFLEWMWLGTTLRLPQILAIALIIGGVSLAVAPKHLPGENKKRYGWGFLFGFVAALGQAGGGVISRKAYLEHEAWVDLSPLSTLESIFWGAEAGFFRLIGGVLIATTFYLISFRYRPWRSAPDPEEPAVGLNGKMKNILLTAMAGPILGIICFQWALATTPSGIVQAIVATTPLVILPMTWVFEADRPTLRSVIGSVVAVLGVVLLGFL